jgi:hypothetical protein
MMVTVYDFTWTVSISGFIGSYHRNFQGSDVQEQQIMAKKGA